MKSTHGLFQLTGRSLQLSLILGVALVVSGASFAGDYDLGKGVSGKEPVSCNQYYFEFFGGISFPPDLEYNGIEYPLDEGYNVGAAVGFALNDKVDLEFEVFYDDTEYTGFGDSISNLALMFNAFYNIPLTQKLTGYVGAGVGAFDVSYDNCPQTTIPGNEWLLGYQFIGGVRYAITDCIDVFTEYRYLAGGNETYIGGVEEEYRSNDVSAGVRFNF